MKRRDDEMTRWDISPGYCCSLSPGASCPSGCSVQTAVKVGSGTTGGFVCEADCTETSEGQGAENEDLHIFVTIKDSVVFWHRLILLWFTLWLFDIAIKNDPFVDDVPIKMVSFHGYVKQPKGILIYILCLLCESLSNFWRSLRLRCSIFGSLLGSCPWKTLKIQMIQECQNSDALLAFAISCAVDQCDRPIFGTINFCPLKLVTDDINMLVSTAIHELAHAAGRWKQRF